jgi:hypothetical protein
VRSRAVAAFTITAVFVAAVLAILTASAEARGGGHGFSRGLSGHGAPFAGGHRHGNDAYIKAASDERDKLLTTRLKSICRGC